MTLATTDSTIQSHLSFHNSGFKGAPMIYHQPPLLFSENEDLLSTASTMGYYKSDQDLLTNLVNPSSSPYLPQARNRIRSSP